MRKTLPVVLSLAVLVPTALPAQETDELPEYTSEQRWDRASTLSVVMIASWIHYAREQGQSVEEFGHWWADLFDDSWGEPGSYGPQGVLRGMRRNWLSFEGTTVDVLEYTDDVASLRVNREPYQQAFGDDGALYGTTVEDFETVFTLFNQGIAEYHGLTYEQELDEDGWTMTFRRP